MIKSKKTRLRLLASLALAGALAFSTPLWAGEVLMSQSGFANWLLQKFSNRETKLSGLDARLQALESGLATWENQHLHRIYLWPGNNRVEYYQPGGLPDGDANLDVPPEIRDGRTFVPLRFVGEALGADVFWDGATQQVTYIAGSRHLVLTIGQTTMLVGGRPVETDAAPMIVNNRTIVPIRFVGQWLGALVKWDDGLKRVEIGYVKDSGPPAGSGEEALG
jgi:hypothetical protein